MKNQYIKQLEDTISKFLRPLKNIPFPIAIKAISGYEVISFNKSDLSDKKLLDKLSEAMKIALHNANKQGIPTARPNEVGNHIEPFVKKALNSIGIKAETPPNSKGKRQSAGYPDIIIWDEEKRNNIS